jgi:uncharacterized protein HemX
VEEWGIEVDKRVMGERREALGGKGGNPMSRRNQRGQTGMAMLALIVALVALGLSVYTYLQITPRPDVQGQLTKLQELVERGGQEMADALKRLEEQFRGSQPRESPPQR